MFAKVRKPAIAAALLLTLAMAGCSSAGGTDPGSGDPYGAPSAETAPSEEAPPAAGEAELTVADTSLGEITVDGEGMTVYMFDDDTQGAGASACEGQCLTNWPPVTTESAAPAVEGVTGEVGTITAADGSKQVTLDGWPLYYFAGDQAAGDVNGQGVGGVWWVLSPAGERMAE
ncbi:hypothetical protein [Microbacterium sp. SD291]|uniref:COG4315 family predicted lipoprotein n=1 Tax=Microbacterium sp. SD291 TaxID=2782007 RepID=UPI001A968A02|nr:hypothetical protein [Microbacterium sp. SD291]MBO0979299.1 hypothetical protein [Microbacterium sp. SD291]